MTAGSRGDVAPFTGLGHGLARAGHEVTLVTHGCFEPLVAGAGVGFHALPVDPRAELESARGRGLHRSATGAGKLLRVVEMARRLVGRMTDDLLAAARANDVLLLSSSLGPLGHTIAEGLRLPSMGVYLQPLAPTREFGPPVLGGRSWGAAGNRLAGNGVSMAVEQIFASTVPAVRARLGLPHHTPGAARRARERQGWPVLHGFSPLVVPRPRDWRPGLDICGYWWPYDTQPQLPPEVEEFLASGPPPVFVGALRQARLRGVIQRGWGELSADGDDMLTVGEVAHSALFPRMAAVVHHCGAGTTAAGLRAGVPAVPVPIQFDEGFWASRLVSLGVAPRTIPLRRLTTTSLAAALLQATSDPSYGERARALAARIGAEDGVGLVLESLHRLSD
ncbi:glycosyltransferase [Streptomyces sp. ME02-8801-2C]|uniref:glycosyltransferase n=1 Tax=Streptomyces sp. ME02-8801-2C TaxID=3028680 RepID=UPI0029BB05AA|nr:glycosyltransferase [Streptomyces sp. ME02-8801-2C]MDX3456986.1 glycosyltransferase [Streptomyces sp. ME02-8801-2C]